jgi:ABC-type Fe3+-siderophore transport system permease subunit
VKIDFSGGNINLYFEQTVGHTYIVSVYVIPWQLWVALVIGLAFVWLVLRRRSRSDQAKRE